MATVVPSSAVPRGVPHRAESFPPHINTSGPLPPVATTVRPENCGRGGFFFAVWVCYDNYLQPAASPFCAAICYPASMRRFSCTISLFIFVFVPFALAVGLYTVLRFTTIATLGCLANPSPPRVGDIRRCHPQSNNVASGGLGVTTNLRAFFPAWKGYPTYAR